MADSSANEDTSLLPEPCPIAGSLGHLASEDVNRVALAARLVTLANHLELLAAQAEK